ncbi:LuxR C-terminal-related transcriptional regulator [Streptomyces sp. NBC_00669]|uniref:helix-turn-helix transcriptional regulator n=1 Tax=Streptomyces sp. NBC_00669 TaxID=2976011 RepID=UPI002E2EEDE1|nr:LuxR C-terminal-related transcriptional regulator [Streptomyces sp. NBC_00669]
MRRTATHTPVSVEELVGACLDGASLLVEIAGEPGSGRTRLLGELAAGARRGGLLVAHGLQVVRASPGRGVVRCLDDLDRAGPETARPLRRLLAERPTVPTVITYTVSTGQPPIWLVSCLAAASDSYRTHRIPVGPLTPEDFAAQLPPGTGPMREGLLYELSGGVPGWLGVLSHLTSPQLRELATADHPPGTVPLPANCPPLRALDGLAPEQIEVVRCAAVLGDPFAPALVAAVADRATHAVLSVLDDLVARDLIRAVDGGAPLFRFRHPLLRTLLYARTPPGRRITAHTRAAEALDRVGAPLVQRAPHLARSAEQGDRRTACLLARAARNVLDTRPATAASWLRAALRILPDDDSADPDGPGDPEGIRPAERFRMAALLYHAAERTGQYAECRRLLPALLEAAGNDATPATCPGDLLDRTLIVDLHTRLESDLGRSRLARALLDGELAADPRPGARGERVLLLRKAAMAAAEGDLPATRRHVHQALRHADRAPDVLRVDAAATLALAGARAGDPPRPAGTDGADGILDAVRMADALGDPEVAGRLDAVARLGWALNLAERHGDALRLLTRALGIARRTGRVAALPPLLLGRGYGHAALGGLSAALRDTREAEETALLLGDGERAGWARVLRAWTTLWCEGPDGAADLADHVLRQHPGPGALGEAAAGVLGWARLAQGRPGECLALVLPAARGTDRPPVAGVRVLWWSAATVAASDLGAAGAREYATRATQGATAFPTAGARAEALRAQALHTPDEAAVRSLSAAVELSAAAGLAVLECRVRLELAQRLVAVGRLEDAATEAGRAKERADRMGARWLRGVAVDTQRRIGASRPRRTSARQGPRSREGEVLSAREEQILDMVCRGMSNREVAGALFVSVKTVEAHLTRIFRKTGARSRASLVAAFASVRPVRV